MKILLVALSSIALAACGGSSPPSSSTPSTPTNAVTIEATLHALEASGKLPTLDRSNSIPGPDANANGIRDDVDAYIDSQGYTTLQLKSVQQTAKALADILLADVTNQDVLRATDLSLQKAINCVFSIFSDSNQSAAAIKDIEKITANTKIRVKAYIKYQVAMDGKVLASPQGDTCE